MGIEGIKVAKTVMVDGGMRYTCDACGKVQEFPPPVDGLCDTYDAPWVCFTLQRPGASPDYVPLAYCGPECAEHMQSLFDRHGRKRRG